MSHSSIEASNLVSVAAKFLQLKSLLAELHVPVRQPQVIWCDNLSIIALACNPVFYARTKHIELDAYFVRGKIIVKELCVQHLPSLDQNANILTKPLSVERFLLLQSKLIVLKFSISLRGMFKILIIFDKYLFMIKFSYPIIYL